MASEDRRSREGGNPASLALRRVADVRLSGALIACAWLIAGAASAHVTIAPTEGAAGAMVEARFSVAHGCDAASTVAVRIRIPEGVFAVKPQMKAGWRVEVKKRKLAQPFKAEHGRVIAETVEEVDWIGGPLPDDLYDDFGIRMRLPDAGGKILYFPVVQECEKGVNRWIEIPAGGQGSGDLRAPAPAMTITPKAP